MLSVIGQKVEQTQKFLTDGTRIPVTIVATPGNTVMMTKTQDKEGYWAVQLGFGEKRIANKPQLGHAKKAQLAKAPLFMTEARFSEADSTNLPSAGDLILVNTVLESGDIVDVRGKSKGKGFAGGVKRYGFHGGPKTHGQSDRHRAPGSIGSGTTPGRVYRGKRMAGKMGNDMTTLKNLEVVKVGKDFVWVKGVVPGPIGAVVVIVPTGKKNKKFVEVLKTTEELAAIETAKVAEETAKAAAVEESPVKVEPEVVQETPVETQSAVEAAPSVAEAEKSEEPATVSEKEESKEETK